MGRISHQDVSPLITGGGIFSQRAKRTKVKEEPTSKEMIRDYGELLDGLMVAFTETVDRAFPNADFLANQPGSHITPDTKLSFVVRASFGLSQMSLSPELVKNYQQTLTKYLDSIQHDPSKKDEYAELLNIKKTYKNIAEAMKGQQQVKNELSRLETLDLPSKTIDRRLKMEWVEPTVQQPVAKLTAQVAKTMRSSERLQSAKLAGRNNSLAGMSRLVATSEPTASKSKASEMPPEVSRNDQQAHRPMAAAGG